MARKSSSKNKKYMAGNEIITHAARAAGATSFFGYPITPASEIAETWANFAVSDESLTFLQCEDEMASGFATMGACLAGAKAFTATAGPGNVLMQDAFSSAESLRVPIVAAIIQRGELSTSTVIYSQGETTLTAYGGNGEGFRIVYSTSSLQDLYDYTIKAFKIAWKYKFPTFILADGYQGKMAGDVNIYKPNKSSLINPSPIMLDPKRTKLKKYESVNMRNCFNLEEEINSLVLSYQMEYDEMAKSVAEYEVYPKEHRYDVLLLAHGIVSSSVKAAIDVLHKNRKKNVGLFRPITIRPLAEENLRRMVKKAKEVYVIESSQGQFARLVKEACYGLDIPIYDYFKPGLGITPEEIVRLVK